MTEDQKRKADVLFSLCKNSWENFDKRRSYEWKFGLAIWTAIAVFITIVLKEDLKIDHQYLINYGILLGLVVTFIHGFWLFSLADTNKTDKLIAQFYEREIHNLLGTNFPNDIQQRTKKIGGKWSPFAQVSITFLLFLSAIFILNTT